MSTYSNPFAGWSNSRGNSAPSIYGALPYVQGAPPTISPAGGGTVHFAFTNFSPSILNCSFVNHTSRTVYSVRTDTSPIFTVIKDNEGRSMALIEWHSHPYVELPGVVPKQEARRWLALSADAKFRTMTVGAARYVWAPNGEYICLYSTASSTPQILARIKKIQNVVTLELSQTAIDSRLLGPCVLAAVLLQSGRNID
ncbi:hypothetical protein JAAARDRAFT_62495 [Jaapia argillacea MUCL 33604]|uniref:DUF6593 domain-containing protein n=1 Tax=Jaapia argillacea MUCL 33604 TaxID=933084 RepID=A0A067P964_9AGAM|nr:hypothetical protein JAAARDRAFT_62495 [Jaapia argillacea MUCL 33604]